MSGVQWQNVPIQSGGGLDTKTDKKAVQAGKLLRLQDAIFTARKRIQKRDGYQALPTAIVGGGNLVAPQMVSDFKGQLVCQDQGILYALSPAAAAWAPQGYYVSCRSASQVISAGPATQVLQSACLLGNYTLYAWCQAYTTHQPTTFSIQDNATGTTLVTGWTLPDSVTSGVYQAPKALSLSSGGNTVFGIVAPDASTHLQLYIYTITAGAMAFTSQTDLTGAAVATHSYSGALTPVYDAVETSTGGAIAYNTGTSLLVKLFDTTGALGASHSFTSVGTLSGISIVVGSNGFLWIYWIDSSKNIKYAVLNPAAFGSPVLGATTLIAASGGNAIFQITAIPTSNTTQEYFYSIANGVDSASTDVLFGSATSGGVVTPAQGYLCRNLDIYSRPFTYSGKTYLACIYRSTFAPQNTVFVLGSDGYFVGGAVAKVFSAAAYGTANPPGYLCRPLALSASKTGVFAAQVVTVDTVLGSKIELAQSSLASFDFADPETYQSISEGGCLVMNGGILWEYDGAGTSELGFNLYPEIVAAVAAGSGGSMNAGVVEYGVALQWTDSQGNFHQSAPHFTQITVVNSDKVTLTIKVPGISIKSLPSAPRVAIFRTQANGVTLTLVDASTISSRQTAGFPFIDGNSDASIASDDELYTNGGVVENIAPPPALAMASHNNRLWVIDTTNENTLSYCKSIQPGVGLSFSDLLQAEVNAVGGRCVALASMDTNLIVLEEDKPLYIQGDGANDAGTGSTLTPATPVPSDAGAVGQRSVIVFPGGVLRKTARGIYLLDRSLGDKYFGEDVEAYNGQTLTDVRFFAKSTFLLFLTSSGLSLIYDYVMGQWGTFTNHQGLSATLHGGLYTYVRGDGTIYQQTPGVYLDNATPYAPLYQTAWLAFAGIQGFQRVRRFLSLGDFVNGGSASHGVQVSAAYDFETTFSTPVPYLFGAASASGKYQYRERLPRQKCDVVSLLVQEIATGDSAEYVDFTNMSFEVGVKRGHNRLAAAGSVG